MRLRPGLSADWGWICRCPGARQIIRTMTPTASAMMAIQRRKSVTSLVAKGGVLRSTAFYWDAAPALRGRFSVEPV